MDSQSLQKVLYLLRQINSFKKNSSAHDFIKQITGKSGSSIEVLNVALEIINTIDNATTVIANSSLPDEAKLGLNQTLDSLSYQFSLKAIHSDMSTVTSRIDSAISNFVILLSVTGLKDNEEVVDGAEKLAKDVSDLIKEFDDNQIDPVVRETAKKHLEILTTLLRHVPIFGLEAALSTYFDLVFKLRRADSKASDTSKAKTDKLWNIVSSWSKRLGDLDKLATTGGRALEGADKAAGLLEYMPDIAL